MQNIINKYYENNKITEELKSAIKEKAKELYDSHASATVKEEFEGINEWTKKQGKEFQVNQLAATILAQIIKERSLTSKTNWDNTKIEQEESDKEVEEKDIDIDSLDKDLTLAEYYEALQHFPGEAPQQEKPDFKGLKEGKLFDALLAEFYRDLAIF